MRNFLLIVCLIVGSFFSRMEASYSVRIPPKVSLQAGGEMAVEGQPISLIIVVDHSENDTVDPRSFSLDDNPLNVELIREEKISPEGLPEDPNEEALLVSRYRAMIPQRREGIYTIGPVHVTVGRNDFQSDTVVIQVTAPVVSEKFRLSANITAPSTIFPGQMVTIEYKIFFTGSMQLLKEELPLLSLPGFVPIGSPEIVTEKTNEGYVQQIRQSCKASTVGTYSAGPSIIEGMALDTSSSPPRLIPPLFRASAPLNTITISPFPQVGKPSFFDGALGSFTWRSSPPTGALRVGDKLCVEYRVSGRGDLSTVLFPDYARISGLQENFWTESSLPLGIEEEGTKRFQLFLRPKRSGPQEIPGFFVASFDPIGLKYLTSSVPPIKIEVGASLSATSSPTTEQTSPIPYDLSKYAAKGIDIPLVWVIGILVGLLSLGFLQWYIARTLRARREKKTETSRDLFYQALMNRSKREKGLLLLKKALYLRLFELRLTPTRIDSPSAIRGDGVLAETRSLLLDIDRTLYKEPGIPSALQEIYEEASQLYHRLKQIG